VPSNGYGTSLIRISVFTLRWELSAIDCGSSRSLLAVPIARVRDSNISCLEEVNSVVRTAGLDQGPQIELPS
jgi:hypothetical protein